MAESWPTTMPLAKKARKLAAQEQKLYLYFQHVVTAHALVVHFIVSIIGIPPIFVLNKGEATKLCISRPLSS